MVPLSLPHPITTKSVPRYCRAGVFEYCPHFRRQGQILVVVIALYPWSCSQMSVESGNEIHVL